MPNLHITVPHPRLEKTPRQMSPDEREKSSRQRNERCADLRSRVQTLLRQTDTPEATVSAAGNVALYVTGLSDAARAALTGALAADDIVCHDFDGDETVTFDARDPVPPPSAEEAAAVLPQSRVASAVSTAQEQVPVHEYPRAVEAVETRLGIGAFIEAHKAEIYRNLERAYLTNRDHRDAALLFIAEALPMTSGIIQVGSATADFRKVVQWAKGRVPNADPGAFLTTLTLIYILEKGRNEYVDDEDEEKLDMWCRMVDCVLMQMQYV